MEHYAGALQQSSKHVYHALPRLLSLWFELTAAKAYVEGKPATPSTSQKRQVVAYGSKRNAASGAHGTSQADGTAIFGSFCLSFVKLKVPHLSLPLNRSETRELSKKSTCRK